MGSAAGTFKPMAGETQSASPRSSGVKGFLQKLGPGLVTGASDDDPSGIGTYSQVGAQFGYGLLWTMVLTYPLMAAIQEISARIGRVTGVGIAANLRKNYPKPLLYVVLFVVSVCDYNQVRPHSALGYLTPEEFAQSWAATGCGKDAGGARLENAPRFPLFHNPDCGEKVVTTEVFEDSNPEKVSLSLD